MYYAKYHYNINKFSLQNSFDVDEYRSTIAGSSKNNSKNINVKN
jgi:hypothetical protein